MPDINSCRMRVYITGIGVVSGIGIGVTENLRAIREGQNGMGRVSLFDSNIDVPVSEVKYTNEELREMLDIPEEIPMSRTALLGVIAAKEALDDSGFTIEMYAERGLKVGLISATSVGGMDRSEVFYSEFRQNPVAGDDKDIITHDCGDSTESIAGWLGITDFRTTISTACSSSANAIILGAEMIKSGLVDVVIAGGTDALCKFTLNGFNSLMILDKEHCRPFDNSRNGLNLGEGAGYLVLQGENSLSEQKKNSLVQNCENTTDSGYRFERERRKRPYAYLSGYSNANDAYHQTASSPDGMGAYLCMIKALEMAKTVPEEVGFLNAHGTGTANNDLSESIAMERVFGDKIPPFGSLKGYIGHTLGASEGIEAALSVAAVAEGIQLPSLNFTTPMEETGYIPITEWREGVGIKHLISNAFGFGGNNSSLVFSALTESPYTGKRNDRGDMGNMCYDISNKERSRCYVKSFASIGSNTEPDYKTVITDANLRRRMSRLIKMGVAAGLESLKRAEQIGLRDNEQSGLAIGAIITATGLGLLADTEKFIDSMIDNKEQMLNPVPFIQSTFNTVGAQIALLTKNHAYNNTHVHRFTGFESALIDAFINLDRGAESVLVGTFDEMTDTSASILKRLKLRSKIGEGASFFILNDKPKDAIAEVVAAEIFYETHNEGNVQNEKRGDEQRTGTEQRVESLVRDICLEREIEIGVVLAAKRGSKIFLTTPQIVYEDLCGEYHTESAFALGMAMESLSLGQGDIFDRTKQKSGILIYNNYSEYCQSIIIVNRTI